MKVKLQRDKVITMTSQGDKVGVYYLKKRINPAIDEPEYDEILLAEMSPEKADKIIALWNRKGL